MIVRTYGRRSRGLTRNYSDVVSESPSQECPQDVYNFTFSSQDSAHCHWSNPYSFDSSQEPRQLTILPSRRAAGCGDNGGRKKVKLIGVDSEPYGLSSSQESKDYPVVEISDGESEEPRFVKKVNYDPFEYDSSQELEECSVLPRKRSVENGVFGFSENAGSWKPKLKDVDSDTYGLNSSLGLRELEISERRVCRGSRDSWDIDGVSRNHKKNCKEEIGVLDKKKTKKNKKKMKTEEVGLGDLVLTSTLMETQEFGEMMEHVDEVNFALDGLKKGQQVKIRRGSLLSLLSICGTAQQRRLLRVHGLTKTIIDAVLGLNFDDPASNLAAAALVYLLTADGQGDRLLESPSCICFLIKMLKPHASSGAKEKAPTIGSKLLGVCRNAGFLQDSAKGTDSSFTAIMLKVQDILVSCKEMKPRDDADHRMEEPKLNPKWVSLLTMEKASLSAISIEDTSGIVRRMGGNFKEKLREFGGLDAVFEVARNCHSTMKEWLEKSPIFATDSKANLGLDSLVVLLKCLKIMENTTFLSKDNQCHLLGMKGKFDGQQAPRSFTELILSVIKILSGVTLLRRSSSKFRDEKMGGTSEEDIHSGGFCNMAVSQKSSSASPCNQCLIPLQPGSRSSQESSQASVDPLLLKMRVESSSAVSCSGSYVNSNGVVQISGNGSELDVGFTKKLLAHSNLGVEDGQDPFAFDEGDVEPSKWELLSGTGRVQRSLAQDNGGIIRENEDFHHSALIFSQQESSNMEIRHSEDASCSSAGDEEISDLLADCLLTAVKVLMNLANDNPEGCHQIAKLGGLEILSFLIAGHFPSFSLSMPHSHNVRESSLSSKSSPRIDLQSNTPLTDQELDFLVAILGLLVNMVEKDGRNRSRLASVTVSLPSISGLDMEEERDVISLLCSVFLANHGAGEVAGEDKCFSLEDEESMLQGAKEAEKMIVEAYSALLLAFLSTESKSIRCAIAERLPNQKLALVVPVLERFVGMISPGIGILFFFFFFFRIYSFWYI
ncbi:wings apart-like protein 2 isoform X2 [Salvia miltiorrhiza]|uniref:wings apart-like protein 2 isoform X2 n=1 Tax=Salvia miltiorrhiza TaxID=226208 RepID=UPI0025AD8FD5|nr:wings apart-like protein 2 isoform X2 [Salvia miltiorrhiza]